jgi:hypothetical protein
MPRGGYRVGAGRKRTTKPPAVVLGIDRSGRQEIPAAVPSSVAAVAPAESVIDLVAAPADLTERQQAFWRLYAGYAIEQGTLVPATVAGFRELCEQFALKQAIVEQIEKVKPHTKRAEVHLRTYVKLAQRLDATLARFKLTSFGKPAEGATGGIPKATPVNPWAQVAGR